MGTASTMACLIEALGLSLPMSATAPAVSADRRRIAEASGKRATEMAIAGSPKPSDLITAASVRNAGIVLQAIGGSTNGLIHLTAIAARAGVALDLAAFDQLGRDVPVLLNLKPSGAHYMEHFHHAGGVPALLRELSSLLDTSTLSVSGHTLADEATQAEIVPNQDVIRTLSRAAQKRRRDGHSSRQSRATLGSDQALCRLAPPDAAHRPRRRLRLARRHGRTHRLTRPRRQRRRRSRPPQCRPQRRAGHARSRLPAHSAQTRRARASKTWSECPTPV